MSTETKWSLNTSEPLPADRIVSVLSEEVRRQKALTISADQISALLAGSKVERSELEERVDTQRASAIEAAAVIARGNSGKLFHVSLLGHVDPDHADGIDERVSVNVDVAK